MVATTGPSASIAKCNQVSIGGEAIDMGCAFDIGNAGIWIAALQHGPIEEEGFVWSNILARSCGDVGHKRLACIILPIDEVVAGQRRGGGNCCAEASARHSVRDCPRYLS